MDNPETLITPNKQDAEPGQTKLKITTQNTNWISDTDPLKTGMGGGG